MIQIQNEQVILVAVAGFGRHFAILHQVDVVGFRLQLTPEKIAKGTSSSATST